MNKIDVKDVNFYYGNFQALKGINMQIQEKSVVAFYVLYINFIHSICKGRKFLLWRFSSAERNQYADKRKVCSCLYRTIRLWQIDLSSPF